MNSPERFQESRAESDKIRSENDLKNVPLLVLANKSDLKGPGKDLNAVLDSIGVWDIKN